jgi:hypothetical protein
MWPCASPWRLLLGTVACRAMSRTSTTSSSRCAHSATWSSGSTTAPMMSRERGNLSGSGTVACRRPKKSPRRAGLSSRAYGFMQGAWPFGMIYSGSSRSSSAIRSAMKRSSSRWANACSPGRSCFSTIVTASARHAARSDTQSGALTISSVRRAFLNRLVRSATALPAFYSLRQLLANAAIANGEALAISVPVGETRVLKHFQEQMPYGLFVPDIP